MNDDIGRKTWAIVGGYMPLDQTGPEPAFTSHDSLAILNTTGEDAEIELTIFYTDRDPVGPYPIKVQARRMRSIRFNDLIEPEALPLETHYAAVLTSNVPVVVQFAQMDTRQAANARAMMMGYSGG
jgi:hypothetical protein